MGTTKQGMTAEEALELSALLEKISKIQIKPDRPDTELVKDLQEDKYLRRGPKGRGIAKPKKKPLHWRTRRKKLKEVYHTKGKVQRQNLKMKKLRTPEGMYQVVTDKWKERSIPYLSLEDWLDIIYPSLGGKVPVFNRYDTNKGFEVENMVVREDKVGTVLFDGMEYRLWRLGYILRHTGQQGDSRVASPFKPNAGWEHPSTE